MTVATQTWTMLKNKKKPNRSTKHLPVSFNWLFISLSYVFQSFLSINLPSSRLLGIFLFFIANVMSELMFLMSKAYPSCTPLETAEV